MLSAFYFFGGLKTVLAVISAAAVHEFGHFAAIKLLGGRVSSVRFDMSGFCMSYCCIDGNAKEIAAILMGPVFGIIFAYAASYVGNGLESKFLFETAGVSMIFSIFNLLPALPLDGGRAVYCSVNSKQKAERLLDISGMLTGIVLVTIGLYFLGNEKGAAFLVAGVVVLIAQTGIVKNSSML